ncbi:unnamed protein product [Brassicogethes aeneus]|uniref:Uncharacterized protein n=1 Tax=Brassicogethes aeneus TaxID=1431903 RepID=A0A9P0BDF1_BRAAE|nr:unnamed protein product [Brassicogethes aeneus]
MCALRKYIEIIDSAGVIKKVDLCISSRIAEQKHTKQIVCTFNMSKPRLCAAVVVVVFCALAAETGAETGCEAIQQINITVYQTVDSVPEVIKTSDTIELGKDAFHIIVANQSIPRLCQNNVFIRNELSVLQIINSSIQIIQPGSFNVTPTLTLLKISHNPLNRVGKGVFNHIKVKELDLSRNFISAIDEDAFDNNTYLEIVKLNYNAIKEIESEWFKNSPNVYQLSIIYNEITDIPAEAFKNMAKERPLKLRFSANRIFQINAKALEGHNAVDIFRLNGNKLSEIPDNIFANRTIKSVEVSTNKLRCFPDKLFESKLDVLAFLENPYFECACLKKVREYVERNNIQILYPAIICEDRPREVNIVFNFNKTFEIPILPTSLPLIKTPDTTD